MSKRHPTWVSIDYSILFITLAIIAYGLLMVFSASYYKAQSSALYNYDGLYLFKRQAVGAVLGTIAMIVFAVIDYHNLLKWKYAFLLVAIILLALVFEPHIGITRNGATRWVKIGPVQLQPAEIAKFSLVVFTSATIYVNRKRMDRIRYGIFPNLFVLIVLCALLYFQPNYSSIIMLCILVFIMMYVGGARRLHLAIIAGVVGAAGLFLLLQEPYRVKRIVTFSDPWQYADGGGHQVIQSLYGIGAGGFAGQGLGNSRQKFLWLPYGESDFIFAITAEEFGFLGSVLLITLFALLVYRGMSAASRAPDIFGTMLASGIASLIGIQTVMNIAVATASMPATGVPMPLFSYGSSSLVIFMAMIGVLLNISRQRKTITVKVPAPKPLETRRKLNPHPADIQNQASNAQGRVIRTGRSLQS